MTVVLSLTRSVPVLVLLLLPAFLLVLFPVSIRCVVVMVVDIFVVVVVDRITVAPVPTASAIGGQRIVPLSTITNADTGPDSVDLLSLFDDKLYECGSTLSQTSRPKQNHVCNNVEIEDNP